MAIVCFSKATGITFLGEARSEHASSVDKDVSRIMLLPLCLLAVIALAIGLFPHCFIRLILSPVSEFVQSPDLVSIFNSMGNFLQVISWILLVFILVLGTAIECVRINVCNA